MVHLLNYYYYYYYYLYEFSKIIIEICDCK